MSGNRPLKSRHQLGILRHRRQESPDGAVPLTVGVKNHAGSVLISLNVNLANVTEDTIANAEEIRPREAGNPTPGRNRGHDRRYVGRGSVALKAAERELN